MPLISRELLLYTLASGLALALDVSVLQLGLLAGASLALAAALGFLAGLVLIYGLSTRLVFRQRRLADTRLEFACFAGIGLVGLALTEVLLWGLAVQVGLPPLPAKMITAVAVFLCNFLLRKRLLFTLGRQLGSAKAA